MYQEGGEEISAVLNGQKLATLFDAKVNKRRHLYFEEACKKIHFFLLFFYLQENKKFQSFITLFRGKKKVAKNKPE